MKIKAVLDEAIHTDGQWNDDARDLRGRGSETFGCGLEFMMGVDNFCFASIGLYRGYLE